MRLLLTTHLSGRSLTFHPTVSGDVLTNELQDATTLFNGQAWLLDVEGPRVDIEATPVEAVMEGGTHETRVVVQLPLADGRYPSLRVVVEEVDGKATIATTGVLTPTAARGQRRSLLPHTPVRASFLDLRQASGLALEVCWQPDVQEQAVDLDALSDLSFDLFRELCATVPNLGRLLVSRSDLSIEQFGWLTSCPDWSAIRALCRNPELPFGLYTWASAASPADLRQNTMLPFYLATRGESGLDVERLLPDDETRRELGFDV